MAVQISERFSLAQPKYERKIKTYSKIHFKSIPGYEQEDLESDLLEVLWRACETYNPDNGATFNTYFWQIVHNSFADLIKYHFREKRGGKVKTYIVDPEELSCSIEEFEDRTKKTGPWNSPHPLSVMSQDFSAEDEAMARFEVREVYRSGRKVR